MRRELRAMVSLAWPVILAEIGWVLMGVVDTIFVGPLGPAVIGGVGIGSTIFFAVMVFGIGHCSSPSTRSCRRASAPAGWPSVIAGCSRRSSWPCVLSVVLVAVGYLGVTLLPYSGIHPDVLVVLQPYLAALLWSAPPLLLFTVFRRYLQAMNVGAADSRRRRRS